MPTPDLQSHAAAIFIADCLDRDSLPADQPQCADTTAERLGVDSAAAVAKLVADLPAATGEPR
jgi:ParB family chromosome partitioning protein